jgi:hypothetical protein
MADIIVATEKILNEIMALAGVFGVAWIVRLWSQCIRRQRGNTP